MPCPASPGHAPSTNITGRYYQGAATVLITRCGGAPRHINLRTTRRQYSATRNVFFQETRINTKAATRQPLTPLRKATPAATSEPCPEQQLITRQNRCLQGVCKCSGASVSHFVAVEIQCGEAWFALQRFTEATTRAVNPRACPTTRGRAMVRRGPLRTWWNIHSLVNQCLAFGFVPEDVA